MLPEHPLPQFFMMQYCYIYNASSRADSFLNDRGTKLGTDNVLPKNNFWYRSPSQICPKFKIAAIFIQMSTGFCKLHYSKNFIIVYLLGLIMIVHN